ncbi:condensation domain-containing protein [Massilia sp. B-10]|nr:condensation domain-containing protein [Massilia sp. B-10]
MNSVLPCACSTAEASQPFDLEQGPLIRGQLLRVSESEHVLLVTQHHIISDGWSTGVLIGEVRQLYQAFCLGQPDPLPPLALQYADYALWQRDWLQGERLAEQTDFWTAHLAGALAADRAAARPYASGPAKPCLARRSNCACPPR